MFNMKILQNNSPVKKSLLFKNILTERFGQIEALLSEAVCSSNQAERNALPNR